VRLTARLFIDKCKGYCVKYWITRMMAYFRAIAQAISHWLPTAAARVWSCGICDGQSGAGAGFLRVLRFPLTIFIPPIAPQSPSSIIWGLYNRPEVAAVPSGLSPTALIIIINDGPLEGTMLSQHSSADKETLGTLPG
jgi:hypothetical protein